MFHRSCHPHQLKQIYMKGALWGSLVSKHSSFIVSHPSTLCVSSRSNSKQDFAFVYRATLHVLNVRGSWSAGLFFNWFDCEGCKLLKPLLDWRWRQWKRENNPFYTHIPLNVWVTAQTHKQAHILDVRIVCEVIASLILNGAEIVHLLPCKAFELHPLWMSVFSLLPLSLSFSFPLSLHPSLFLFLSFIHSHTLMATLTHTHTHTHIRLRVERSLLCRSCEGVFVPLVRSSPVIGI